METRVAVLSIIVENEDAVGELNELLHRFGKFIIATVSESLLSDGWASPTGRKT